MKRQKLELSLTEFWSPFRGAILPGFPDASASLAADEKLPQIPVNPSRPQFPHQVGDN
jgi:hypothetical protein